MFWRKKDQDKPASPAGPQGRSERPQPAPPATRPAATPQAAPAGSFDASDSRSSFLLGSDLSDRQRLDALFEAITRVTDAGSARSASLDEVVAYLVDLAVEFARAERGFFIEEDEAGQPRPRVVRAKGAALATNTRHPQSLVRKLLADGEAVCTRIDPDNEALDLGSSIIDMKLRAVMAVRLEALRAQGGRVRRGVLYVDSRQVSRTFTPGDLRFFQTLSAFIAIAVRNADWREALVQKAQQDRELELARQIREDLNPAPVEDHPVWEVAAWAVAETTASGDFYDWSALPGGRLAVQCGDVAGHDIGAALIMASAASATRAHLRYSADPAVIISRVARDLRPHLKTKHLTAFLGLFDAEGELRALNAGHTPPLHWKLDGSVELLADTTNAALGWDDDDTVWQALPARRLEPGEMLVMVSDGFTEAHAPGSESLLGEDGLARLVAEAAPAARSAAELVEALKSALLALVGGDVVDDTTLVVVRRK